MKSLLIVSCLALAFSASPSFSNSVIADAEMTNQDGKAFHVHDLKGSYLLVSFVFSTCPSANMCPLTLRLNRQTAQLWKKRLKAPLRLLVVTLDPESDTPAVLKKLGKTHQLDAATTTLATGKEKALSDFESSFNVAAWPSGKTVVHNLKTILVGPDLTEIKQFKDNEWKPEDVLKAVPGSAS